MSSTPTEYDMIKPPEVKRNRSMREAFVRMKIHLDRTRAYFGIAQFFLTLFVSLKVLANSPFKVFVFKYWYFTAPVIIIICVCIFIFIGWVDLRIGLRQAENKKLSEQNPVLMDMIKQLEEIKNKIK